MNNARFKNLITSAAAKANPPVVASPAPTPAPQQELIVGQSVVEAAKEKADSEQAMLRDVLGLAINEGAQFYRNGTKMMASGEARAKALRQQWEEEPVCADAMESMIDLIKAEERQDYKAKVRDTYLDQRGLLSGVNGGLVLTENSFTQLLNNFRGEGAADVPPRLRQNFNLWRHKSEKTGLFRTRNPQPDGTRTCYAVVGSRYGVCDLDFVAREVARAMPKDAHATWTYNDAKGLIEVSLAPTFDSGEIGVGRLTRIMTTIKSADDGTGSIDIGYKAVRIRCINCTLITDDRLTFKRRHVGQHVSEIFREALAKSGLAMEIFASKWREANMRSIVDKVDGGKLGVEETFKRLVAHGYVHVPHVSKVDLVAKLMHAYEREPGSGAAGINMAITRMAHESAHEWRSVWYVDDLERQAGDLLFQNVFELPRLSDEQVEAFAA